MKRRPECGDAADCWRLILTGEIVRAAGAPASVRDEPPIVLGRSGRWQTGLARLGPALDDALGATAFAVAWRMACAQHGRRAWPGARMVAETAVGELVGACEEGLACAGCVRVFDSARSDADRSWVLGAGEAVVAVIGAIEWTEIDRTADIAAAWLDLDWSIATRP